MLQKELYLRGLMRFQRQICHKATVIWKKPMKNEVSWQITFQITVAEFLLFQLVMGTGLAHALTMTVTKETCIRGTLRKLCQQLCLLNKSDINLDVKLQLFWQKAAEPVFRLGNSSCHPFQVRILDMKSDLKEHEWKAVYGAQPQTTLRRFSTIV